MAALTDLEKVRHRRAKRRMVRNLFVLALFAVVVYLCVTLIRQAGEIDLKTAYSDIRAEVGVGAGYPLALPGGKVSRLGTAGDLLTLLTDTNIYAYNDTGKQMLSEQHGMAKPLISTARDRVLLCERGGSKVSVFSKSALIHTSTVDYTIYNADLAENGNYAIATGSDESLAQVEVYNKAAEQIFKWYSSRPVIDVSLSDNREAMVVGCVDVSDGSYRSNLSRFQFSIDKPMGSIDLPGELLLSLDQRGGKVYAITDQRAIILSGELSELASYRFEMTTLNRFYEPNVGPPVLVFGNYAQEKQQTIVTLDENLKRRARFSVKYDMIDLRADQSYVYVAGHDRVEIFGLDGVSVATVPVANLSGIELIGDKLYCTTAIELLMMDIKELTAPPKPVSADGSSSGGGSSSNGSSSSGSSGGDSSADSPSDKGSSDEDSSGGDSSADSTSDEDSSEDGSSESNSAAKAAPSGESLVKLQDD